MQETQNILRLLRLNLWDFGETKSPPPTPHANCLLFNSNDHAFIKYADLGSPGQYILNLQLGYQEM